MKDKSLSLRFAAPMLCALALTACTHTQAPVAVAPPPAPTAPTVAEVAPLPPAAPVARPDPYLVKGKAAILQVQKALVSLGYKIKKPDGEIGPATVKALAAFQKDRGLPENSRLTLGLADKIRAAADEGRVTVTAIAVRPGDFLVYSDGEEEVASAERSAIWEREPTRAGGDPPGDGRLAGGGQGGAGLGADLCAGIAVIARAHHMVEHRGGGAVPDQDLSPR